MEKKDYKALYQDIIEERREFYKAGKIALYEDSGMTYTRFITEIKKYVAYRKMPKNFYYEFRSYCEWYGGTTKKPSVKEWCEFFYLDHKMPQNSCEFCPDGDALTKYFPDERF